MTRTERQATSAEHAQRVAALLRDRRERDAEEWRYVSRAKYPTRNTSVGASRVMYSDEDRQAFANATVRVVETLGAILYHAPAPGTYPECDKCSELHAGCIGNSEVTCYVHERYQAANDWRQ